jgi:hypothetical protein
MPDDASQFSASEPALGYLYQLRYALLQILRLPEETTCFIEKDDDIDFTDADEGRILASLKHKAPGDTLTDLSPDFWKSVRIWLTNYLNETKKPSSAKYILCTTGKVQVGSFLTAFLPDASLGENISARITGVLDGSKSKTINKTKDLLAKLPNDQWPDFFRRITIYDCLERIQDVPELIITEKLRTVRPQFRRPVYERLEGWWTNECIELLTGKRQDPFRSSEVSEMLSSITEQFREDNLPIDFEDAEPEQGVNPDSDDRHFVKQLRAIGLGSGRLTRTILDYYRAFEQRGKWQRENVTLTGEIEKYDDRLVDEWARIREIIFDELKADSPEEVLQATGRKLFTDLSTRDHPNLRIRADVTATYVVMGSYHMLANEETPRVHWHPRFTERMAQILHGRTA